MAPKYEFSGELWEHTGEAPWVFVTVPIEDAEDIRARVERRRGFGSVKVRVRIGGSEWGTSLFPDAASGSYVLPIKRAVRAAEGLRIGDIARVGIEVDQI